jgi:hypothetical protein
MKDFIEIETVRCNNHRCTLRTKCGRYLQLPVDFHEHRNEKTYVNRFSGSNHDIWGRVTECEGLVEIQEQ